MVSRDRWVPPDHSSNGRGQLQEQVQWQHAVVVLSFLLPAVRAIQATWGKSSKMHLACYSSVAPLQLLPELVGSQRTNWQPGRRVYAMCVCRRHDGWRHAIPLRRWQQPLPGVQGQGGCSRALVRQWHKALGELSSGRHVQLLLILCAIAAALHTLSCRQSCTSLGVLFCCLAPFVLGAGISSSACRPTLCRAPLCCAVLCAAGLCAV